MVSHQTLESKVSKEHLLPYLKQYGRNAYSYATLQEGMEYFVDEGTGYIAYTTIRHPLFAPFSKKIVLSDPVCAKERTKDLTEKFLQSNPRAIFVPISEDCGNSLKELGFKVNCVGYEPVIDIQSYNTAGNWKELDLIKRARNEARRNNIKIREGIDSENRDHLIDLSKKWLKGKKLNDREIWIYARKPVYTQEEDVRKFLAFCDNEIVGFAFYDPIYENGKIIGYSDNLSRCDEERFGKLSVAMNMEAIDKFKKEGKRTLNLCLAPFDKVENGTMNDDFLTKSFFKFMYNYGEEVYNFKGLSFHKMKYRANNIPVYFASNGVMPVNDVYLAFKSSDIAKSYFDTILKTSKSLIKHFKNLF